MASIVTWRRCAHALPLVLLLSGATDALASDRIELAQAQPQAQPTPQPTPAPAASPSPAPAADAQQAAPEEPIGNVATVTGIATVIRDKNSYPLRVRDDIFLNDIVQTSSNSSLGITFSDATTFNLSASSKITIDNYVYEDGGKQNAAIFDVAKGTVAFVAAAVAKTGEMQITTPTAALGIRGTTGVVEVPSGATANNVNIKLYPDADGRVGHIDVNDRTSGSRLGALTQGASGFAIRPGTGAMRFAAVPITIAAQQIARDRAFVGQVHLAQTTGRQIFVEQRDFRRANPAAAPRIPRPQQFQRPNGVPGQPGQPQRPNGAPGQGPQRQNGLPGQNRPGEQQQQPGAPNRQGTQPPQRQGQDGAAQPGSPRAGQGQQPQRPGQGAGQGQGQRPNQTPGQTQPPRAGQTTPPAGTPPAQLPRAGQNPSQQPGGTIPRQPGVIPPVPRGAPQQPGATPPAVQPQQGGLQRQPGMQQRMPGAQRQAAPRRPAAAPKEKKERH